MLELAYAIHSAFKVAALFVKCNGIYTRARHSWKGCKVLFFRFGEKVLQNVVNEAILHIHLMETVHHGVGNRTLTAYSLDDDIVTLNLEISKVFRHGNARASSVQTTTSVKVSRGKLREGKWVKVDVTPMVSEWFRFPRDNLTVIVKVQGPNKSVQVHVPHSKSETNSSMLPFLEVYLEDKSKSRSKRMLGMDCMENSQETRCCRYPLTVNFEEFGWDWVIAPKKYDANYCSGDCPLSFFQRYPHTHIVQLATPPGSAGPCCAPKKMSSISMLYFDQELNIVFGTLPGMVVERCGCS